MEIFDFLLIGTGFFISLVLTFLIIKPLNSLEIVGVDLHKTEKQKRPKIGGLGIAIAFIVTIVILYLNQNSFTILVLLLAFFIEATIGLLDDFFPFKPLRKIMFASFGAIPLLFLINLDPISIIFLFVGVSIASNWTNMLAGFNGLEAGMGALMLFFLAMSTKSQDTQLILLIYSASLIGFLLLNRYPAKIFPGDVGTLPIGTVLIGATLLGASFSKLAILFIPHFVDALLKFSSYGIMSSSMTKPTEINNGVLTVTKNGNIQYLSLCRAILILKPLKEWELVLIIWTIEIILGVVTLLI